MSSSYDQRRKDRTELITEVEFTIRKTLVKAFTVDISENGLKFETDEPLTISIRFKEDESPLYYEAKLIWAKTDDAGVTEYGFEYTDKVKLRQ
jgi:hypothetical protein